MGEGDSLRTGKTDVLSICYISTFRDGTVNCAVSYQYSGVLDVSDRNA